MRDIFTEKRLLYTLGVGIALLLLLSLTLIHFLSLSFDEAWLFSIYQESSVRKIFDWRMAYTSMTNSGLFVLLNTHLYTLFGSNTVVFRLVSFTSLLLIIIILYRWCNKYFQNRSSTLIVIAAFLGTYGTVELGAYAHGAIFSFLFLICGIELFYKNEEKTPLKTLLLIGLCFGAAASSRLEYIMLFPAVFLENLIEPHDRKKHLQNALVVCFLAALFFLIFDLPLFYRTEISFSKIFVQTLHIANLDQLWIDYPRLFNKWVIAFGFLPLPLIIAGSFYAFSVKSQFGRVLRILAIFGWLILGMWIFKAPIAHLRYIWPCLASFGIILGFGLGDLYEWSKNKGYSFLVFGMLCAVLGMITVSGVNALRALVHGEGDIITWEWSRESPMSYFRRFKHYYEQQEMAKYLSENIPPGETLGVIGKDLEFEMMTGIKVVPLEYYSDINQWNPKTLPKRLLITPMIGNYLYLSPSYHEWIEKNLTKEVEFGHYILYRLTGTYPETMDPLLINLSPYPSHPKSKQVLHH